MTKEWLIDYGFQTVITGIVSLIIAQMRIQGKRYKEQRECDKKTVEATQAGVRALLKNGLIAAIHKAKMNGFIRIYELENINTMFKEYQTLGGNGAIEQLVEELRTLPIKTDLK